MRVVLAVFLVSCVTSVAVTGTDPTHHTGEPGTAPLLTQTLGTTPVVPASWAAFQPYVVPEPDPPCVTRQQANTKGVLDAERGPDGTVWAFDWSPDLALRLPDGRASTEPLPAGLTFLRTAMSPAGELFGWTADENLDQVKILRRDGPAAWSELPLDVPGTPLDLTVLGSDDVRVLVGDFGDYTAPPVIAVWRWDGAVWNRTIAGILPNGATSHAVLSDGTDVVAGWETVSVVAGGRFARLTPAPTGCGQAVVAADDTIVAFGTGVAMWTASGGFADLAPPLPVGAYVTDAWAGAADDILVATSRNDGAVEHAELWHFDGAGWTQIPGELDTTVRRLFGPTSDLVALGHGREAWAAGDTAGITLERDSWGMPGVEIVAVDRAAREAWSGSTSPTLQQWTGGRWVTHRPAGLLGWPNDLAIDDGIGIAVTDDQLVEIDHGTFTVTDLDPSDRWTRVASGGGASFLIGESGGYPSILRNDGTGWAPLVMSSWPSRTGDARVAWASGANDLWLGVTRQGLAGAADGGGIVRWDGSVFTVLVDGLPTVPLYLSPLNDGTVVYALTDQSGVTDPSVWSVDTTGAITPVSGLPPDTRAAQTWSDGTWVVESIAEVEPGVLGPSLTQGPLGGPFVDLLHPVHAGWLPFASWGDTVWSQNFGWTWTYHCEP